jgi:hypothetical protein
LPQFGSINNMSNLRQSFHAGDQYQSGTRGLVVDGFYTTQPWMAGNDGAPVQA